MIKLIEQNGNIDLTAPIVYKNPVKPYIDTSLIKDWRYMFHNGYRGEWDLDNTDFSGGEDFTYCFNNHEDTFNYKDIYINAPNATNYSYAFRTSNFNKVTLDTTSATTLGYAFQSSRVNEVEFIGTTAKVENYSSCFNQCTTVHTIKGLDFSGVTKSYNITSMLGNCASLENCIVTGKLKIYSNNFKISGSPKLTRESVLSFANAIENVGTSTYTLYFGAENLAKLTDEEKAELTAKNFILA